LKKGDPVLITNTDGQYLVFQVVSMESYLTKEAPLEQIFGDTDEARLNLITCTGKYNRETKEYEERLVVYTRLMR